MVQRAGAPCSIQRERTGDILSTSNPCGVTRQGPIKPLNLHRAGKASANRKGRYACRISKPGLSCGCRRCRSRHRLGRGRGARLGRLLVRSRGVDEVGDLVRRAALGDREAWSSLVGRFADLIWSVGRSVGLGPADAADVSQTTWLRFCEHLSDLNDPSRAGAWLAKTARREAIRVSRLGSRQVVADPWDWLERADSSAEGVDHELLQSERVMMVQYALALLPERCRRLLMAAAQDPPVPYRLVAGSLGLAVGSVGPARGRCLEQLRRLIEEIGQDMVEDKTSSWARS
jgi:RNA polymerase sigma factor (sigma-70 family)